MQLVLGALEAPIQDTGSLQIHEQRFVPIWHLAKTSDDVEIMLTSVKRMTPSSRTQHMDARLVGRFSKTWSLA